MLPTPVEAPIFISTLSTFFFVTVEFNKGSCMSMGKGLFTGTETSN